MGVPVAPVTSRRVALRGTALLAARALAPDTATGVVKLGDEFRPIDARHRTYSDRAKILVVSFLARIGRRGLTCQRISERQRRADQPTFHCCRHPGNRVDKAGDECRPPPSMMVVGAGQSACRSAGPGAG